jgi:uncharacterized protein (TIGR03435 family)
MRFERATTVATGTPPGYPSLFTAVRTLGLKLVSGKAPIDVLVVDGAQKPSEN